MGSKIDMKELGLMIGISVLATQSIVCVIVYEGNLDSFDEFLATGYKRAMYGALWPASAVVRRFFGPKK